jgi:hypothetical protein
MVVIRGRLEPEVGAVVVRALEAARDALHRRARSAAAASQGAGVYPIDVSAETRTTEEASGDGLAGPQARAESSSLRGVYPIGVSEETPAEGGPTHEQRQADALALVAETALHHGIEPVAAGERYQVVVHVDAAALADPQQPGASVLEDGPRLACDTARRLACDATRVVMRHDEAGQPVEVGARTRTIPPALRRALQHRDRGCRFPGCGSRFTQGHHLEHWANGGPTTLANLALLCRRHHRADHEEGFQVARAPDGALRFRDPRGRDLPDVPAPPRVPADPVAALREQNHIAGLSLDARTALPGWQGERLDLGWALDVLHPLANPL